MFYKDIHKYLQVLQHKFHASKDYKQSLWEGEGTKEKNQNKTNQKCKLPLPLEINFNKWKAVSGNLHASNSFSILQTTYHRNIQTWWNWWRRNNYRKYCQKALWKWKISFNFFFCISLGWTSNRAWQVAFYTKCPSEHTSFPMRNVTVNIISCSSKCHFIHWSLTHHGQAVPLSCNWMLCAWPKEVVLVTASRRRDSSERCIQINGLNKVFLKYTFTNLHSKLKLKLQQYWQISLHKTKIHLSIPSKSTNSGYYFLLKRKLGAEEWHLSNPAFSKYKWVCNKQFKQNLVFITM